MGINFSQPLQEALLAKCRHNNPDNQPNDKGCSIFDRAAFDKNIC
jgi:hypothetical protein